MAEFTNTNKCYSFNIAASTSLQALSSFTCSEVLIYNKSTADIFIRDVPDTILGREFLLGSGQSIVMRGITNTANLSVQTVSGTGMIYCRSAYFSNLNQQ